MLIISLFYFELIIFSMYTFSSQFNLSTPRNIFGELHYSQLKLLSTESKFALSIYKIDDQTNTTTMIVLEDHLNWKPKSPNHLSEGR